MRPPDGAIEKISHMIKQDHTHRASPSILPFLGVPGQRGHEVVGAVFRRGADRGLLLEGVG